MNRLMLTWLVACSCAWWARGAAAQSERAARPETILIGCVAQYTWTPLVAAQEMKFFEEENLNVRVLVFPSARAMANAFCRPEHHTHLSANRVGDLVFQAAQGYPVSLVCELAASRGMDKIIIKSQYAGLDDPKLRGKRIACELRTMSHYFLTAALRQLRLQPEDFELVDMGGREAANAFVRGLVDAAVTWEPAATFAHKRGQGKEAFTTADIKGGMPEGLCAQDYLIKRYPDIVVKVLRCWFRAREWGKTHEEEYLNIARRKLFYRTRPEVRQLRYYRDLVQFYDARAIQERMKAGGPLDAFCQDVLRFYEHIGEIRAAEADLKAYLAQGLMINRELYLKALPAAGR